EEAHDYRYFPDPDLVPMVVDPKWIEEIRAGLPELPDVKRKRYLNDLEISEDAAAFISEERATAEWFEAAVDKGGEPKSVANWMMGELTRRLNDDKLSFANCPVIPIKLVELINDIDSGKINARQGKTVFNSLYDRCKSMIEESPVKPSPADGSLAFIGKVEPVTSRATSSVIREELGIKQSTDTGTIEKAVQEVLDKNPDEVERFRGGDQKLMGFFVGQVMKATRGEVDAKTVNEMIKKKLG
ncbi:MAG: hypothetical protein KAR83_04545, partial [Thermodesulfovibrionales bacterium]|nr:hypothetical protein [Thermodesulfovibrionales bacterium]